MELQDGALTAEAFEVHHRHAEETREHVVHFGFIEFVHTATETRHGNQKQDWKSNSIVAHKDYVKYNEEHKHCWEDH